MVETRHSAAPTVEDELPEPSRAKRARPARVIVLDEPLEMVETHKDTPPAA